MRFILVVAVTMAAVAARAGYEGTGPGPGLTGNDTGGIIQWTPYTNRIYRVWAAEHCARWNRRAVITSVHRRYGDYIGFTCEYVHRYDPRKAEWKAGWHFW